MSEIKNLYKKIQKQFAKSPNDPDITKNFAKINQLAQKEIDSMNKTPLASSTTANGKNYIVFTPTGTTKKSRPVNIDLYLEGLKRDANGQSKIDTFWSNVKNQTIKNQPARDITVALYVIAMNYSCCTDIVNGVSRNAGDYFEKLIGHLYSRHLNTEPSRKLNSAALDGVSISLPTDYIFDVGEGKPKLHVPVKTTTRERAVEVWAQQRILDGAFGVGRFLCLFTCLGEANMEKNMHVGITCVPNQWINYQLFISQIKRVYYLDMPEQYRELNKRFPRIYVKEFGEFFHESNKLFN